MGKIYQNLTELIGKTPLLQLNRYGEGLHARIFAKLEYFNPAGSVKDRVAAAMIDDAEKRGLLTADSVLVEPTSGNTGIGLASVAAAKGYRVILTMPETMSIERQKLLKAYGAEIILTPGSQGMQGAVDHAKKLAKEIPNAVTPGQFVNPANPQAHRTGTGPEIWDDADGKVDIFVAGIGTGGTITGIGEFLKGKKESIQIVGVEPASSPLISKGKSGAHGLQGIGANFIPDLLNREIITEMLTATEENAYTASRQAATKEGILVGISSGAALWAAKELAQRSENQGKNIVVLLPDGGDRYLSTPLFG